MKINSQNSLIKCHHYAMKKRDWFKCAQSKEANELYFRSFMRNMAARRGHVVAVFFGWYENPAHYLDVRAIRWLNSSQTG